MFLDQQVVPGLGTLPCTLVVLPGPCTLRYCTTPGTPSSLLHRRATLHGSRPDVTAALTRTVTEVTVPDSPVTARPDQNHSLRQGSLGGEGGKSEGFESR